MSIYKYISHVNYLSAFLESRKNSFPKWTQRKLASLTDIQTSYLSNALKGKVGLSQDQLFRVANALKLDVDSKEYLLLLGDFQQCTDHLRKEYLNSKIQRIKEVKLRSESKLGVEAPEEALSFYMDYFSDPLNKVVHVALSLKKYIENPKLLTHDLKISNQRLEKILNTLEETGVILIKNKKIEVTKKGFHLPEDHPLILAHQTLIRQISITQSANYSAKQKYSFSATFSCEEKNKDEIKAKLLASLKDIQGSVKAAKSERVYQLNIDMFPWLE